MTDQPEHKAKDRKPIPRTLIWLVVLFLVWGGSYMAANLIQPNRFADANQCIAHSERGTANACDFDIVLTMCIESAVANCHRMTLEPNQFFVPAQAQHSPPILGETFACTAPFIPYIGFDPNNATLRRDACHQPE